MCELLSILRQLIHLFQVTCKHIYVDFCTYCIVLFFSEMSDLKQENKNLYRKIEDLRNEQKDLLTQVMKLQDELATQYKLYRDERDARKLLQSDINDLRYQQEDYQMSQKQENEEEDDPVMLKIALK